MIITKEKIKIKRKIAHFTYSTPCLSVQIDKICPYDIPQLCTSLNLHPYQAIECQPLLTIVAIVNLVVDVHKDCFLMLFGQNFHFQNENNKKYQQIFNQNFWERGCRNSPMKIW